MCLFVVFTLDFYPNCDDAFDVFKMDLIVRYSQMSYLHLLSSHLIFFRDSKDSLPLFANQKLNKLIRACCFVRIKQVI